MFRRALCTLLCLALAYPATLAAGNRMVSSVHEPQPVGSPAPVFVEQDLERFRAQLLGFLHEMDAALLAAVERPELSGTVGSAAKQTGLGVPFAKSVYDGIENATSEQLEAAQAIVFEAPELFQVPAALRSALDQMAVVNTLSTRATADCTENYSSFTAFKGLTLATETLSTIVDALKIAIPYYTMAMEIIQATTADVQFVGKIPSLPAIIIVYVLKISVVILGAAQSILSTAKDEVDLDLSGCCQDASPSELLAGRGCDNRDNNCAGGIDEAVEDRFAPIIAVDSNVVSRCHRDEASASEAVTLAVTASDDCSDVTPETSLAVSGATCQGTFTARATDDSGNTTTAGPYTITVDATPPELFPPTFLECYRTVAEARNELQRTVVRDCTQVRTDLTAVESRCAAQLELEAVDECGRRSAFTTQVTVDGTPPSVDIRKLLLPSVDGTFCFESAQDAVDSVAAVTVFSDNCTSVSDLSRSTTAGGEGCDLVITSAAMDECARRGQDRIPVRVDTEPPAVSCSVALDRLWPPTGEMIDVGFSMSVGDNCDAADDLDVEVLVTSDEPTALARRTLGADPYPDTVIERDADGNVTRILLRAERSDFGPADGRVYRIRVVATDSCGLSQHADCWVQIPRQDNRSQAINSGQDFEADSVN